MTDTQYTELIEFLAGQFDGVHQRLTALEVGQEQLRHEIQVVAEGVAANGQRIGRVEVRVDRLEKRVDALEISMLAGFAQVDSRFAQVDTRFAQVDSRFAQVDSRFDGIEAILSDHNRRIPPLEA